MLILNKICVPSGIIMAYIPFAEYLDNIKMILPEKKALLAILNVVQKVQIRHLSKTIETKRNQVLIPLP